MFDIVFFSFLGLLIVLISVVAMWVAHGEGDIRAAYIPLVGFTAAAVVSLVVLLVASFVLHDQEYGRYIACRSEGVNNSTLLIRVQNKHEVPSCAATIEAFLRLDSEVVAP